MRDSVSLSVMVLGKGLSLGKSGLNLKSETLNNGDEQLTSAETDIIA